KRILHAPESKASSDALTAETKRTKQRTCQRMIGDLRRARQADLHRCFRNSRSRKRSSGCKSRDISRASRHDAGKMSKLASRRLDSSGARAKTPRVPLGSEVEALAQTVS